MAKYRKKPVVIEAERWMKDGDHAMVTPYRGDAWAAAVYGNGPKGCSLCDCHWADHGSVATLEGVMLVCPGDWIITGVQGEHYPCKNTIFEKTYEAVAGT